MKKLTHEEFVSSLYEANQNLTVLGQYINSSSHIDMKCDICGYEWSPVANDIRRLHGCPRCSGQVVKSTDYFIQMLSKSNKNVEIISEYNGYKKKSLFRCKIHDIEFEKTGAAILRGVSCEECTRERSSKSRMKTTEQFKQDLFRINKNIFITSEYSGSTKKDRLQMFNMWTYMECGGKRSIKRRRLSSMQYVTRRKKDFKLSVG